MKKNIITKMFIGMVIILSGLFLTAAAFKVAPPAMRIHTAQAEAPAGNKDLNGDGQKAAATTTCPCDIYAAGGTPCIAAHSTVRALFATYNGNLYQVRRSSDNTTRNIPVLSPGGFANSAVQDSFCSGTTCVITVVYDQSGNGNDLWYQGSSVVPGSPQSSPAKATSESLTVSGNKVYSLYINPGNSYWRDGHLTGVPTGSQPEGMYMVTSGTHVNSGCCFDYGNSETTRKADAAGAMDAINFSTQCWFGGCSGTGPWVQADLEWGLYPGGSQSWNPNQRSFPNKYVTAMLKNNGTTRFALKGGNAQSGTLTTLWDGSLPNGYSPMKKQGAIILGSGGDCCKPDGGANLSAGTFYEGAMVAGYPSDATDNAIQANIIAAGYGASTPPPTPGPTGTPGPTAPPQSAFVQIEAENFTAQSGIQTETCSEGGEDVGYIENGDYIAFNGLNFANGAVSFKARVASATSGGNIEIRLGSTAGTLIGTCAVAGTGDWQTWTNVSCNVSGVSGIQNLYLVFTGGSGYLFNFNWFQFTAGSGPTPTPAGVRGDVDGDGTVTIVDALMTAQYSVGLTPAGFIAANADVNCDGSITIVDALIIAQYYVGLITGFQC